MHPHVIPGLPIQSFGLCIAIGLMLAWTLVERLSGRKDLSSLVFLLVACGIVGARLAHVVEYWTADGFDRDPLKAFEIWNGGLVFYGGLIGGILAFFAWCWKRHENVLSLADLLCVAIPLGHLFGRIGCFCFGCCWGKCSDSFLAVRFPAASPAWNDQRLRGLISSRADETLPVLPTQLIEAVALLVLFAVLYALYRRHRAWTAATYLCGYGVLRFFIEFLRDDDRPNLWGLSSAQLFSLFLILVGIGFFLWSFKRHGARTSDHR